MKLLPGIIVGAFAGVVAGILLAPESGEKTRKKLAEEGGNFKDDFEGSLNRGIDTFLNTISEAVDEYSKQSKQSLKKAKKKKNSFF